MPMMQKCQSCGQQPLPGARFCRHCGAPLFRENEGSTAQTRQYRSEVATPPVAGSGAEQSASEAIDTSRFYQPPAAPPYAVPHPQGSASNFWIIMALLCAMAVAGIIGSLFVNARINRARPADAIAQQIQERIAERQADIAARQSEIMAQQAEKQAEQMARQIEQQADQAAQIAEQVARGLTPPPPPAPPGINGPRGGVAIDDLVYPGAEIETNQRVPGSQILKLRSSDSSDKIARFYQVKLGHPPVARTGGSVVFIQKSEAGQLVVTLKPHPGESGQTQIQIIQTR